MKVRMLPTIQKFKLAIDPEGAAEISVRQLRNGDFIARARMTEQQSWKNDTGLSIKWNGPEMRRFDAYRALCGAIGLEDADTGEPIFRFNNSTTDPKLAMTEVEFYKVWDALDADLSDEIYEHIVTVNPTLVNSGE